jgi:hypothetical protein
MKVQLGGGTDIGQAVYYAESLIDNPRRAIVVLITDFCEGAPVGILFGACKRLIEQGTPLLGLAALDAGGEAALRPRHCRPHRQSRGACRCNDGGELAAWVAEKVR